MKREERGHKIGSVYGVWYIGARGCMKGGQRSCSRCVLIVCFYNDLWWLAYSRTAKLRRVRRRGARVLFM